MIIRAFTLGQVWFLQKRMENLDLVLFLLQTTQMEQLNTLYIFIRTFLMHSYDVFLNLHKIVFQMRGNLIGF